MFSLKREDQDRLDALQEARLPSLQEKVRALAWVDFVPEALQRRSFALGLDEEEVLVVLRSLFALGQGEIFAGFETVSDEQLQELFCSLAQVESFYASIGGVLGYHARFLKECDKENTETTNTIFHKPSGLPLCEKEALLGIKALPSLGMLFPIGGLGDRLDLRDDRDNPLPVALLPFAGASLLEGLVRDCEAFELLFEKLFAERIIVPMAMMTSLSKQNHQKIFDLLDEKKWFGRPSESFRLFSQPLVPVIDEKGNWVVDSPCCISLKPSGHGAIWTVAEKSGVFDWFESLGKNSLLIRQINNPLASTDHHLMSFLGRGVTEKKAFGFASCERLVHAAEGVLVVREDPDGTKRLVNIEYTDFTRYGIADRPRVGSPYSLYPANTNILFADLPRLRPQIQKNPLPGLMVNLKSKKRCVGENGEVSEVASGRLECMMQAVSELFGAKSEEKLETYLTTTPREKTISVTKKKWLPGGSLLETPQGAYYDLLHLHTHLLQECGMQLSSFSSREEFASQGPSHLFLFEKALGPFYSIIKEKIRGGQMKRGSAWLLELAEVYFENLHLEGSFCLTGDQRGHCHFENVKVVNRGVSREAHQDFWKGKVDHIESLHIHFEGIGECIALDVEFYGDQRWVVPEGRRLWLLPGGKTFIEPLDRPHFSWSYQMSEEGSVVLKRCSVPRQSLRRRYPFLQPQPLSQ